MPSIAFNLPDRLYARWVEYANELNVSTGQFARAAALVAVANWPESAPVVQEAITVYQSRFPTRSRVDTK